MKKILVATLLLNLTNISLTQAQVTLGSGEFKIIGDFYNHWGSVNSIQYGYLNIVDYCFASVSPSTGAIQEDFDPDKLNQIVATAHKRKVAVLLTIGGPKTNDQLRIITENASLRQAFIASALQLIKKYNLDGLDIDWEYPLIQDGSSANYVTLLKNLYPLLNSQGKLLSICANASGFYADCIASTLFPYIDYIKIMAYDDPNKSSESHSTYNFAEEALDYWILQRNLPKYKAVLGVPSYGRATKDKKVTFYKDLVTQGANPNDDVYNAVDYNGLATARKKATLAKQRAGGIFMWEINLDTKDSTSLLRAIHAVCE